ncbi:hypothetical protein JB92DRAFT_2269701 [Gautieria morchelliformis]|nr:hypothetical protein JB92DRAFT_2269701 [Gautieria morchelliformis]
MVNMDKEWIIDNIVYKYRDKVWGKSITYGSPPNVCRALRPQWLTMPALNERYQEGKRPIQDVNGDSPVGRTSTTSAAVGIHWFQRHLCSKYQMKFVGLLGKDVVAKLAEELSQLCDEALHHNLDSIAHLPMLNPFLAAVEQDATSVMDVSRAASCEADIQQNVAAIVQRQHIILENVLANRSRQLTEPITMPLVFGVDQVYNAQNVTNHDSTSLRTMAWPNSTPCTDIAVSLANTMGLFETDDGSFIGLNSVLRNRIFKDLWNLEQKCWIVPKKLKNGQLFTYQWPSCTHGKCFAQDSGTAQCDSIQPPALDDKRDEFQAMTAQKHREKSRDAAFTMNTIYQVTAFQTKACWINA